jgi:AcrR family transcriptional regulator
MSRQTPAPPVREGSLWEGTPATSRRLIEAATEAFAERGYHATTTRDIATRVGMSPAALYVHFPSKVALLAQISRLGHEAAAELVDGAIDGAADPVSALRAVASRFSAWHAEHHRVARIVQNELAALPAADLDEVMRLRQHIERRVEEQLQAGVAAGVMAVDDTRAVARAVLSLTVDVARWYDPGGRDTPEAIGALHADLAARMVRADDQPAGRAEHARRADEPERPPRA